MQHETILGTMARPLRIQYPGAYYHVYCRGNNRQKIFLDDHDRFRFLKTLRESLAIYNVILYFYVLMDNHFHIGVQTVKANLSEFMRRFNITYTGWFNFHHATCGHLYQGRYKAILVDADNYFLELSRYVHLNPIRKEPADIQSVSLKKINSYKWSSLPGYLAVNQILKCVNYNFILNLAGGRQRYGAFLLEGIKGDLKNPLDDVQHQVILGDKLFMDQLKNQGLGQTPLLQIDRCDQLTEKIDSKKLIELAIKILKVNREDIYKRNGNAILRGVISDLLYRYSDMTQVEIGRCLGIDHSAVSRLRTNLKHQRMVDDNLAKLIKTIEHAIIHHFSNFKI